MARRKHRRVRHDWYTEEISATHRLLAAEEFSGPVYDPACGMGHILTACRDAGIDAIGSDLVKRGDHAVLDFLSSGAPPIHRPRNVICNPPFKDHLRFIERSLSITAGKVAMYMPLRYLGGIQRADMFQETRLTRVLILPEKARLLTNGKPIGNGKGRGRQEFAWFIWRPGYRGEPRFAWSMPDGD